MDDNQIRNISDFHERLSNTTCNDELVREFSHEISQFGFHAFAYGIVPVVHDPKMEYLSISTLADDWMHHYVSNELFAADYAIAHCLTETRPLPWSELATKIDKNIIPNGFHHSYRASSEFRVSKGVTMPIASHGKVRVGMSLIAAHEDNHQTVDYVLERHGKHLQICAELFHVRIDPSQRAAQQFRLTQKNLDILRYVVDGLTAKEIAKRVGGSPQNINDHLARMFERFGAKNRTQLAAKARLWGIC